MFRCSRNAYWIALGVTSAAAAMSRMVMSYWALSRMKSTARRSILGCMLVLSSPRAIPSGSLGSLTPKPRSDPCHSHDTIKG